MPVFKQSYNYHLFTPSKWLDRREELSEVTSTVDFVAALAKCACQGTRTKSALILSSFINSQVFFLSGANYISDLTEFYRKKNIYFKLEHPTAIHQHFKGGSECVLAIMLPKSNHKFWFFTIYPQVFLQCNSFLPSPINSWVLCLLCREKKRTKQINQTLPSTKATTTTTKSKPKIKKTNTQKHTKPPQPATQLCLNQCKNILKNRY